MGIFDRLSKKKKTEVEKPTDKDNGFNSDEWFFGSFLMNEAKFRHQQQTVKRSSKDDPITLRYIIKELLNISPDDIGPMTIVSRGEFGRAENTELIETQAEVLDYKPYDALLYRNNEGELVPRTGLNTVLVISYRPGNIVFDNIESKSDKSKLCTDNSIIMFLRGIGPFVYETAYMRVSVMIPNFTSPDDFRTSHSKNAPFTTSFILGFDIVPPEKKLTRYDQIEQSLIEKSNRGEELSSEEKTVLEGITYSKDLGYDFGYGRWLVSENRFADALMPLMKAYNHLKTNVVTEYDRLNEIFEETCFNIGFCFNELEQYDRATYYLDLIQGSDKPKYIIEYINSLVNNGDPRALQTVRHYLSEFNDGKRQIDSEETSFFYDFLARRLAYLFIDYKMWDNARNLLEQLKESPACHDFAVKELDYIEQLIGNSGK